MTEDTMMAAVALSANAPLSVKNVPKPALSAGQVMVRVRASAINPLDTKVLAAEAAHARQPLPAILGIDLAGVVEAVGADVTGFRRGDEVYGMTGGVAGVQGSLAEFASVDADLLAPMPSNLSMREAAALPLIFITAWEGLVDRAAVKHGHKVLIHGGAGGVGHVAIQIAKARGAQVFATGSARSLDYIRSLGATAIDYEMENVDSYVSKYTDGLGFDIVYDTSGGATLDASFLAVRRFGHVVSCLGWGTHALAPLSFRAATYSGVFALLPLLTGLGRKQHGLILREATRLAESGNIVPRVDPRRFYLDTVDEAHRILKSGEASGKLVVDITGSGSRSVD